MNEQTMKVTRLATIHKDLMKITTAVRNAASDVEAKRSTIAKASAEFHTPANDEIAARLDRMTLNTTDIGFGLRTSIRTALDSYTFQRDRCKRNRAQFIQQGAIISGLTYDGMFQELIALRKSAKAEAAEQVEQVEQVEAAPVEAPVDVVIYFQGTMKGEQGPAVGLKHITKAKDINAALAEAIELFDIAGGLRAFINGVELGEQFTSYCLEEVSKEEAAKAAKVADLVQRIESRLKADGIDFMDEEKAVASLSECVAPTLLVRIYREELARRSVRGCPTLGPSCRGCPDCGAVMGGATYRECFSEGQG